MPPLKVLEHIQHRLHWHDVVRLQLSAVSLRNNKARRLMNDGVVQIVHM